MNWPRTPVDRLQSFRPPFCPRRECPRHTDPRGFRYRSHGSYATARNLRIPRFRCLTCGSTFSRKAFSLTYYLKRPELLRPVAAGLLACSAHRQLARTHGCAPSTVTRLSARLGRHALLLMKRMHRFLRILGDESLVIDPFETFELTQDLPFGVTTVVGSRTWLIYALEPAVHARTGRRTPQQERRRRSRAARDRRGGYEGSYRRVLDRLLALSAPEGRRLELVGDGDPALDRAVAHHPEARRLRLHRYPNPARGPKGSPRSREAIERDEAMFPVDLLHMLFRHSLAAHKRETIAMGRRMNSLMERFFVAVIWRNLIKGVSERRGDPTTPAMRAGLTDRPWSWQRVLGRRLFPDREGVDGTWLELYRRDWITAELGPNTRHLKVFAY
jgi:transposase-like protein